MITPEFIYVLMGVLLGGVAIVNVVDRRYTNALFWGLFGVTFAAGSHLPDVVNGFLVIGMVAVASRLAKAPAESTTAEARSAAAGRWGNRLFVPALCIPLLTLAGTFVYPRLVVRGVPLVDPRQVTLVALAVAVLVALGVGMAILRPPLTAPVREARRLFDTMGWAAVLPQTLAALGAMFALAGVGGIVSALIDRWIPITSALAAVTVYTVGMALFTVIMGNAFAAFPVMTAGIGLPIIVHRFGGDVVVMAALGMLSGFCGTLCTPMAANFNMVPAALLELSDEHAVIKAQLPTAILLLAANTVILYVFGRPS